jgi:hypothetical protein
MTFGSFGAFAAAFKPAIPVASPDFVLAENQNTMHAGKRAAAAPGRLSPRLNLSQAMKLETLSAQARAHCRPFFRALRVTIFMLAVFPLIGPVGTVAWGDEGSGHCLPEERLRHLREDGPNKTCAAAIERSLGWLKEKQNADGSWGVKHQASMTGLALLAYLGYCETPLSEEYGDSVRKAITYLVNLGERNGGKLTTLGGHSWVYEHAICTQALCDAYRLLKKSGMELPVLERACVRAVRIVLDGQHPTGAWDYDYNKTARRPGDTSIVGWHMLAIKAASDAGFEKASIPKAVARALKRLAEVQNDDGTFGYTNKGSGTGQRLVGVGALGFQIWGKGESFTARNSARWIATNLQTSYAGADCNLYASYFTTLFLFHRGAAQWEDWRRKWGTQLLENQNVDGSWKPEGNFGAGAAVSSAAGPDADIYRVCLNTLSLEAMLPVSPRRRPGEEAE